MLLLYHLQLMAMHKMCGSMSISVRVHKMRERTSINEYIHKMRKKIAYGCGVGVISL